jgi:hypothetical protein
MIEVLGLSRRYGGAVAVADVVMKAGDYLSSHALSFAAEFDDAVRRVP